MSKSNEGKFPPSVFTPYADWLVEQDRFEEAQAAYRRAECPDKSLRILEFLTHNAVTEKRYDDASYYYWLLALEHLKFVKNQYDELTPEDLEHIEEFEALKKKSEIYYAYRNIAKFVDEPFTSLQGESLFHIARYLINALGKDHFYGIR